MNATMPRPRSISQAELLKLVDAGGGTWRHTSLSAALTRICGCSERTARRILHEAIASGAITKRYGIYETAPPPGQSRRQPSPGVRTSHARRLRVTNSTGRRRHVARYQLLAILRGQCWRYGKLIALIQDEFGCCESTARDNIRQALGFGYLERSATGYRLTALAIRGLDTYGRLEGREGVRFARYCSGRPGLRPRQAANAAAAPRLRHGDGALTGACDGTNIPGLNQSC